MRTTWLVLPALAVVFLAMGAGPAQAASVATAEEIQANAAKSCSSLKRKANRARRGSAKRRRYLRRYRKCRARARKRQATQVPPASGPAPAPPEIRGPVYLPSIFPNPNGYRSGAGCLPGYETTYRYAGFSCQYAGYNSNLGTPTSPVYAPVYLLFGLWYCADKQFRFRC